MKAVAYRGFLVLANFAERNCSGSISVGFLRAGGANMLDTTHKGRGLACSLESVCEWRAKQANTRETLGKKSNTLVASCLRGALPPVDRRAVCLVRAMKSE
jgi:hypothetical protein